MGRRAADLSAQGPGLDCYDLGFRAWDIGILRIQGLNFGLKASIQSFPVWVSGLGFRV